MAELPDAALELWHYKSDVSTRVEVFPDGCRDLIVSVRPGAAPECLVSALADRIDAVPFSAGQFAIGVRMRAGARIDEGVLLGQLRARDRFDAADLLQALDASVRVDVRVQDALDGLAMQPDLAAARARLGVGERALERLLTSRTGRPPVYWRNLARARRCARALASGLPLVELAVDHGYADQAHMTRDMQRWFGASPSRMRLEPRRFAALRAAGHG